MYGILGSHVIYLVFDGYVFYNTSNIYIFTKYYYLFNDQRYSSIENNIYKGDWYIIHVVQARVL